MIVFCEVRTWDGISPGAQHYYAKLKWAKGDDRKEQEVLRVLDAKSAARLNKCDDSRTHKAGAWTYRFETEQDAIHAAIRNFEALFPGQVLILGDSVSRSAMPVLCFPPRLEAEATRMTILAKQWEAVNGYEGNEKEASRIDAEWFKLFQKVNS